MRYVEALIDEYNREEAYRIYVSTCLQLIPQNKYVKMSYTDMINPQKIDRRSGEEIAFDVMNRAGLHFEVST
jgi:hypothetical protein